MTMNFLYLDVLPLRSAEEVGGFTREATRQRGLALAITWDERNRFRAFTAQQHNELIGVMNEAQCIVGYNCRAFDFEILQYEPPVSCDLFTEISEAAKQSVPLRRVYRDLGTRPILSDTNRLTTRWRAGKRSEVITAFSRHVGAIRRLHQHILQHGWILYESWEGEIKRAQISLTR